MGYTHYWYQTGEISPDAWRDIVADANVLLADAPCKIALEYDEPTKPFLADDEKIVFNGIGDKGHETFWLNRAPPPNPDWRKGEKETFAFCKTARKPYDILVCAMLVVARHHAREAISIDTDGDPQDWTPAIQYCFRKLGRLMALPFKVDAEA